MAEIKAPVPEVLPVPKGGASSTSPQEHQKRGPPLHEVYALPAPIRTFPLHAFQPSNPISLLHLAYSWAKEVLSPPASEPSVIHHGVWSPETFSVHVSNEKSMWTLWQQGFYGKGNLSRSEPNWLKREKVRRGLAQAHVSEILTVQRREERQRAKWERARLEQEAIRQTRADEALKAEQRRKRLLAALPIEQAPPVGPLELLALPNSAKEMASHVGEERSLNILGLPSKNSYEKRHAMPETAPHRPGLSTIIASQNQAKSNSLSRAHLTGDRQADVPPSAHAEGTLFSDEMGSQGLKRQKSVRFSPKVESSTFELTDPPSPSTVAKSHLISPPSAQEPIVEEDGIENHEHLQLMPEEAFFLSFGLGALSIADPVSGAPLSSAELLQLFRQYSFFPPRIEADDAPLEPDDHFLVHYAVYHHFRSLGWVPRAGIKFGVDWLLYTKGPVFDHAEFGLVVVPSYTDPQWTRLSRSRQERTWYWLHSVVRVLSHVMKSLVLVYVDIPSPAVFNQALHQGIPEALKLYKVREVMVKRWSSNRNR